MLGVEPESACTMHSSLGQGSPASLPGARCCFSYLYSYFHPLPAPPPASTPATSGALQQAWLLHLPVQTPFSTSLLSVMALFW